MRIVLAMVMAAGLALPAVAADRGYEQGQVRVQTADLDLASASGQRALDRRISVALTRLCGTPVLFSRDELDELNACQAEAMKAAAPQIDAARALRAVTVATSR